MAERRHVQCPLCGKQLVVSSEEECVAHMEQCGAFAAKHGEQRKERELAPVKSLEAACGQYALAILPLVPSLVTGGSDERPRITSDEACEIVVRLTIRANVQYIYRQPLPAVDANGCELDGGDFDISDLTVVSLRRALASLNVDQASSVKRNVDEALFEIRRSVEAMSSTQAQDQLNNDICRKVHQNLSTYFSSFRYCEACGTSGCRLSACSRCKGVYYCSQSCQRKRWSVHKVTCIPISAAV
eukprot:TRINITY_DN50633_c0_g1_i1.p1 TRINITY_DN50633_c0_g1~~TRINITY_DN50633_c0_g1_i1.p1  ORF type:complete len:258 (+),score=13.85 TRINITY_DN50633_c0_g1_i1:48-776(+)